MMNRSIPAEQFISISSDVIVLDIRRREDFESANQMVLGASWKDPACMEEWIDSLPNDKQVVIYCVRGGGISNSVVDRLLAEGREACFIEGGIVALEGNSKVLVDK